MAIKRVSGLAEATLTTVTPSSAVPMQGAFLVAVRGTFTGSVVLERCADGTNYVPVASVSFSTPDVLAWYEPCEGVLYRLTPNLSVGTAHGSIDGGQP